MQSMHRQLGKIKPKGSGDDAKVSVLLQDFTNVDEVLTSVSSLANLTRQRPSFKANSHRSFTPPGPGEMRGYQYWLYN